jgi:glycosyltransferase involved in cell wall biosynthesis
MKVCVYTVAWNEEQILPHFLRHYARLAERIVVYDNGSDDATRDIVRAHPQAELRSHDTGGVLHDGMKAELLSTCYREVRGAVDWVVAVDCDEFLFHPRLEALLARYLEEGVSLPRVSGYSMVTDDPIPDPRAFGGLLAERYVFGAPNPNFDKRCVFRPSIDIQFGYGQHHCRPEGPVVESASAELKLLHYKHFAVDYVVERYRKLRPRLSGFNERERLGFHYRQSRRRIQRSHARYKAGAVNVLHA